MIIRPWKQIKRGVLPTMAAPTYNLSENPNIIIPKVFHRIWLGGQPMPKEWEDFEQAWRQYHPDWTFYLWNEDNLPLLRNQWAFDNAVAVSGQTNIARYEILFRFGGIYIDNDFECLKSIEPLLDNVDCFVGMENRQLANNAIIGCTPAHPLLLDLITSLEHNVHVSTEYDPDITRSGPYYLTRVLERHKNVTLLPVEWFYPYEWHERWRRYETFPDAFAVHHWALSWRPAKMPKQSTLGDPNAPCLTIAITQAVDDERLEWVLEGLCLQTITNFEVVVVTGRKSHRELVDRFQERLTIRCLRPLPKTAKWQAALKHAKAPRLLILHGNCVPDHDTVETHALKGEQPLLLFGFAPQYPASKFFPYRSPVDYHAFAYNCARDPRREAPCFQGNWMDVEENNLSAPTQQLKDFCKKEKGDVVNFAKECCYEKVRLIPLWNEAITYRLLTS